MKSSFCFSVLFAALVVVAPAAAFAAPDEAGVDNEAGVEDALGDSAPSDDASSQDESNTGGSNDTPLACDGALCDTTVGATTCDVARGLGARTAAPQAPVILLFAAMAFGAARRRAHHVKERTQ